MDFQSSALLIISALAGLVGMPLIDWFKNLLKVDGNVALAIATVVSLVLAFVSLLISGQFVGVDLTLPNLIEASGVVFSIATLFYKAFWADK